MDHQNEDGMQSFVLDAKKDKNAFRELYRIFFPRIFAYAAYRVGKRQDAEDLVSATFEKALHRIADFEYRGQGSFSAWLFQIVRNEVNSYFRRNHRDLAPISIEDIPNITTDTQLPHDVILRKEQFIRLRTLIGTLPSRRQEVILLKYYGGMRNQEIALVLDLDERTIASHLSRGLQDLQKMMMEEALQDELQS
jgi:RNA polymerase sigma-70 factor (ECF subfamily)